MDAKTFREYLDQNLKRCEYITSWGDVSTDLVQEALERFYRELRRQEGFGTGERQRIRQLIKLFKNAGDPDHNAKESMLQMPRQRYT